MGFITTEVYRWLVIVHHSAYDYRIWHYFAYSHGKETPLVRAILALIAKDPRL